MLGSGGFAYVYEMEETRSPHRRFAAKVIGVAGHDVYTSMVLSSARVQYEMSEQSDHIIRVVAMWGAKLKLDTNGDLRALISPKQEEFAKLDYPEIHIVLMEKLTGIIAHDRYGRVSLLREELRSEEGIVEFARQIGDAIFTLHDNNYMHRDIKLENIFWDSENAVYKLGDFDIAKFIGEAPAETVAYTNGYGAPEIEGKLTAGYGVSADIYSFGVTLYLLANNLRFPASDGYHVNRMVQYSKDFIFPAPAGVSEGLARVLRKMCSYQNSDRYQSVREVLMDMGVMNANVISDYDYAEDIEESEDTASLYSFKNKAKVNSEDTAGLYNFKDKVKDSSEDTVGFYSFKDKVKGKGTDAGNIRSAKGKRADSCNIISHKSQSNKDGFDERGVNQKKLNHSIDKKIKANDIDWLLKVRMVMNREQKMKLAAYQDKRYLSCSLIKFPLMTVLFFVLFECLSPVAAYVTDVRFLMLPVALLFEAALLRMKELYVLGRFVAAGLCIYSMIVLGIDIPNVMIMIIALFGNEVMMAACAFGSIIWAGQTAMGLCTFIDGLSSINVGWVVTIALFIVIRSYYQNIVECNKVNEGFIAYVCYTDKWLWKAFAVIGAAAFILSKIGILADSSPLVQVHLVRLSIAALIFSKVVPLMYWGYDDSVEEFVRSRKQ